MDLRKIKKLIDLLEESNLTEIEIKEGEESVRLSRTSAAAAPVAYAPAPAPAPRAAFDAAWQVLEQTVRACKDATLRNGQLMAEQHGIMQRVLHGEEQLYAPR